MLKGRYYCTGQKDNIFAISEKLSTLCVSHCPNLSIEFCTLQLHYLQDSDSDSCTKRSRPAATKPAGKSTNRPRGRPALEQKKQPAPHKASKAQKLKLKEEKMKETVNRKRKKVCF